MRHAVAIFAAILILVIALTVTTLSAWMATIIAVAGLTAVALHYLVRWDLPFGPADREGAEDDQRRPFGVATRGQSDTTWATGPALESVSTSSLGLAQEPFPLTDRELEILRLMAVSDWPEEIAHLLSISTVALQHHIGTILDKTGSKDLSEAIANGRRRGLVPEQPNFPDGLSAREAEVLRLYATGLSSKEVSWLLRIHQIPVLRHLENIKAKAGASDRAALLAYARSHRLDGTWEEAAS